MVTKKTVSVPKTKPSAKPSATTKALDGFAGRLAKAEKLRPGSILLRLRGEGGGDFCLECSKSGARVGTGPPKTAPRIEVMASAKRLLAILDGKKDGRLQFLAGGIRVRGDLRYLSDLAMELGILKQPIWPGGL